MTDNELERLKLDALAEFAAGAGHEINNPLTVISGHAEILMKNADSDQRSHLSIILAQTRRAYEMIADIRLFARPPMPQWENADLIKFLNNLARDFLKEENHANIEFSCRFLKENSDRELCFPLSCSEDPFQVEIRTDFALLRTVLGALIKNAQEAIGEQSGKIDLFVMKLSRDSFHDSALRFLLEDNGPGIPEEFREQIFSPYFSGRSAGRGLGFGLTKAWRLLQSLGGTIQWRSPEQFDHGCGWNIEIPLVEIPLEEKSNSQS